MGKKWDKRSQKEMFTSKGKDIVYDSDKEVEDIDDSDEDEMKKAMKQMILLTDTFQKKFFKQPGSNSQRFSSKSGQI